MNQPTLGDYELHVAWEGFASIRQISSGEIMHSRTPPMEEAQRLYIEQSNLSERLQITSDQGSFPLVIWDVGLGAAANAMAAIYCYEKQAKKSAVRPLKIISFENDLDSLRLAFMQRVNFPYLVHDGPAGILENARWTANQYPDLSWLLIQGDFVHTLFTAPPPDLIYYDMFSSKSSNALWSLDTFRKLFDACLGRAVELFTYTCSTANRVALLAAGFYVARGRNAGKKLETTIALTPAAAEGGSVSRYELLGADWLKKWNRSKAKVPSELDQDEHSAFEQLIRGHPQFSKHNE
jgi:queuine tRNA-ribosyltransferase